MNRIRDILEKLVVDFFSSRYQVEIESGKLVINDTRPEFKGDYTIVVFPLAGLAKTNPAQLAEALGTYLEEQSEYVASHEVVKGFLNLTLTSAYWHNVLDELMTMDDRVRKTSASRIVLEYSSPNTNKPLHLGHIRNILVGWSVGQILRAVGHDIHFTQIINDRGIAICKSMLAWKMFGWQTPKQAGIKPDHSSETIMSFREGIPGRIRAMAGNCRRAGKIPRTAYRRPG